MFHAVIRTDQDAFHLIGDLDDYALQTLQQHVRSARNERDEVRLEFAGPPSIEMGLNRRFRRWVQRLIEAGIVVEVIDSPPDLPWPMRPPADDREPPPTR